MNSEPDQDDAARKRSEQRRLALFGAIQPFIDRRAGQRAHAHAETRRPVPQTVPLRIGEADLQIMFDGNGMGTAAPVRVIGHVGLRRVKELCEIVAKTHADRKLRHFSFSTSSHPIEGRSIDVCVTQSTSVLLDAPLGW